MWAAIGILLILISFFTGRVSRLVDATILGFVSLGIAVGLCLGLSASPILGMVITSTFTLLGVIAPLYFKQSDSSVSNNDRLPHTQVWLFPFASSLSIAMLLGIFVRVNDSLNFQSNNLRVRYAALGFDEKQIEKIMDNLASSEQPISLPKTGSSLQSFSSSTVWKNLYENAVQPDDGPKENLQRLKQLAPDDARRKIESLEKLNYSPEKILTEIKPKSDEN
jgi:hypothetical protein